MFLLSCMFLSTMPMGSIVALGFVAIVIIIVSIVVSHSMDDGRIRKYIAEQKGGRFISKQWKPFGRGWFGDKSDRIYLVQYEDKYGDIYEAFVKTSMFSGVYLSEEKLIKSKNPNRETKELHSPKEEALIDEIVRLREENERLKKGK